MPDPSIDHAGEVRPASNRVFGLVFAGFFAIVGLLPLAAGGRMRVWALACAVAFLVAALAVPRLLGPLNLLWTKFGALLHRIVSPIVLGLMFFLVITPIGLVMRLLGRDPLALRFDPDAASYWVPREPPGPAPASLKDPF